MKRKNKLEKALHEMFVLAYQRAEPSADFDELVANAKVDENGKKDIGFNNYYLSMEDCQKVYDEVVEKYNIKKKNDLTSLSVGFYLGASPTSSKKRLEKIRQKQSLIDMMKSDEESGLYDG